MSEKKKRIAIIGASYLQLPLIEKAKEMGIETHVFAWKCGDIGEIKADHFHPISIVEKDQILEECKALGISGICSIASDLAVITVNYVAEKMNLKGNGIASSLITTNKYFMKKAFEDNDIPAARCILVQGTEVPDVSSLGYPIIVKPTDRSGSRGVTRLDSDKDDLKGALERAIDQSFDKKALIEEYVFGDEYSVECISNNGSHTLLSVTYKYTTGNPHYIEKAHMEPAPVDDDMKERIRDIVFRSLDAIGVKNGASHSELKICGDDIKVIEIGARMGGDMIGSSLVMLSTGYDFVKAVIDICLGNDPAPFDENIKRKYSAIRYLIDKDDYDALNNLKENDPGMLIELNTAWADAGPVVDSSSRKGYYIMLSEDKDLVCAYLP